MAAQFASALSDASAGAADQPAAHPRLPSCATATIARATTASPRPIAAHARDPRHHDGQLAAAALAIRRTPACSVARFPVSYGERGGIDDALAKSDRRRPSDLPQRIAKPRAQSAPGCKLPEHRQFDFWVGTWDVSPTGQDQVVARSLIENLYGGCVDPRELDAAQRHAGGSLNTYDPDDKRWHQTWIDASNARVSFDGGSGRRQDGPDRQLARRSEARAGWPRPHDLQPASIRRGAAVRPDFDSTKARPGSRSSTSPTSLSRSPNNLWKEAVASLPIGGGRPHSSAGDPALRSASRFFLLHDARRGDGAQGDRRARGEARLPRGRADRPQRPLRGDAVQARPASARACSRSSARCWPWRGRRKSGSSGRRLAGAAGQGRAGLCQPLPPGFVGASRSAGRAGPARSVRGARAGATRA